MFFPGRVIQMIDENQEQLRNLFRNYNVMDVQPAVSGKVPEDPSTLQVCVATARASAGRTWDCILLSWGYVFASCLLYLSVSLGLIFKLLARSHILCIYFFEFFI